MEKVEAPEADYLFVAPSKIEGAGNGLFSAIDIFKDEVIAVFDGEILTSAEIKERKERGDDRYFICLPEGGIMDSSLTDCFAKYANDAQATLRSAFSNNALITLDDDMNVCLQAKRDIPAGDEIFCSYGRKYWKRHGVL